MVFEGVAGHNEWKLEGLAEKLAPGLDVVEVLSEEGICSIKTVR